MVKQLNQSKITIKDLNTKNSEMVRKLEEQKREYQNQTAGLQEQLTENNSLIKEFMSKKKEPAPKVTPLQNSEGQSLKLLNEIMKKMTNLEGKIEGEPVQR